MDFTIQKAVELGRRRDPAGVQREIARAAERRARSEEARALAAHRDRGLRAMRPQPAAGSARSHVRWSLLAGAGEAALRLLLSPEGTAGLKASAQIGQAIAGRGPGGGFQRRRGAGPAASRLRAGSPRAEDPAHRNRGTRRAGRAERAGGGLLAAGLACSPLAARNRSTAMRSPRRTASRNCCSSQYLSPIACSSLRACSASSRDGSLPPGLRRSARLVAARQRQQIAADRDKRAALLGGHVLEHLVQHPGGDAVGLLVAARQDRFHALLRRGRVRRSRRLVHHLLHERRGFHRSASSRRRHRPRERRARRAGQQLPGIESHAWFPPERLLQSNARSGPRLTADAGALESPAVPISWGPMSLPPHPEAFVRWFRQVAPYVHAFRGRTFVIGFGGELVAERGALRAVPARPEPARGARHPAGAGARRAPADRGRAARQAPALALRQGPAHHRRAIRWSRSSTRPASCASKSRRCSRRACRTRRWRARRSASPRATTSPPSRSAWSTASISSSPARCARWTPPRSRGAWRRARSCWCRTSATRPRARCSTSPGKTSPRAWRAR